MSDKRHCRACDRWDICDAMLPGTGPCETNAGSPAHNERRYTQEDLIMALRIGYGDGTKRCSGGYNAGYYAGVAAKRYPLPETVSHVSPVLALSLELTELKHRVRALEGKSA